MIYVYISSFQRSIKTVIILFLCRYKKTLQYRFFKKIVTEICILFTLFLYLNQYTTYALPLNLYSRDNLFIAHWQYKSCRKKKCWKYVISTKPAKSWHCSVRVLQHDACEHEIQRKRYKDLNRIVCTLPTVVDHGTLGGVHGYVSTRACSAH